MALAASAVSSENVTPRRMDGLSIALWVMQGFLGVLFVFAGVMKFVMPAEQMLKDNPFPLGFLYFIGVCEILGGIGLVVPALLRIRPVLTPIAALGLVIIMIGATIITMPKGAVAVFPLVIGVLASFVAYGRLKLRPVQARI